MSCNSLTAGQLRHRVKIQKYTETKQTGQVIPNWGDYKEVWARVTPKSGSETAQQQGVSVTVSYSVVMRYRTDITEKDRLIFRGKILDIVSIINTDSANIQLEIEAIESK